MSKASVTPLTIGLLVIGLLVGLGGGYIIANNTYSPQIETLEESITAQNTQLLEDTNQIAELEANISELDTEESEKEITLSDIQEELSEVLSEKINTQDELDAVVLERISLEEIISAKEGYNKLALFRFSLEYPTEMELSMILTMQDYLDDSYGGIIGEGQTTAFTIIWEYSQIEHDTLKETLNDIVANLEKTGEVNTSSQYEFTIAGIKGLAMDVSVTDENQTIHGKYFTCYSTSQELLYKISVTAESHADLEELSHIIESVELEESE